jgi:hypothetical protein
MSRLNDLASELMVAAGVVERERDEDRITPDSAPEQLFIAELMLHSVVIAAHWDRPAV